MPRQRLVTGLVLSAALVLSACGGAATPSAAPTSVAASAPATASPTAEPTASPMPEPTAEPTESPTTAPTEAPAPSTAPSAFAFPPGQVVAYYQSVGFECAAPQMAAAGYSIIQCLKGGKKKPTALLSIGYRDEDEVTHYGYAGYFNDNGEKKPSQADAFAHLGGAIGAFLGTENGTPVGAWVYENFGDQVNEEFSGLSVFSYPLKKNPGSGYFIEMTTPEFLAAYAGG